MAVIQLMHAGEEALFVLIPVGIVLYLDFRKRRKEKAGRAAGEPGESETPAPPEDR